MNWTLPEPLLLFAGVMALLPLAALVRRPTSTPRPVVEAFLATLAVTALVWLAWVALWLIEQRWCAHLIARPWLGMTLRVPPAPWRITP